MDHITVQSFGGTPENGFRPVRLTRVEWARGVLYDGGGRDAPSGSRPIHRERAPGERQPRHAALAREAVLIYLDGVGSDFGHEELDRHWRRVSLGYASLRIVPRRAFAVLLTRARLRFGLARLRKIALGWRGAVRA
jgi:hypothetical protein